MISSICLRPRTLARSHRIILSTSPKLAPGRKLANCIEHYAEILDLNVWVSSTVTSVTKDAKSGKWEVSITRKNGEQRKFNVNRVVFATGFSSGTPSPPSYPGQDEFKGGILHASPFKRAGDYVGKRVLAVGACTSGHDIAEDCFKQNVDVTMFHLKLRRHIFALDDEGEVILARHSGVYRLWYMVGNFSFSRFFSTHLALQIKAIEEGIYGTRHEQRTQ